MFTDDVESQTKKKKKKQQFKVKYSSLSLKIDHIFPITGTFFKSCPPLTCFNHSAIFRSFLPSLASTTESHSSHSFVYFRIYLQALPCRHCECPVSAMKYKGEFIRQDSIPFSHRADTRARVSGSSQLYLCGQVITLSSQKPKKLVKPYQEQRLVSYHNSCCT